MTRFPGLRGASTILMATGIASGAELHVPGQFPYIQAAINAAADGDQVVIAPGTYIGPNNRDLDLLGKAITVRSSAPGDARIVAATVIDCQEEGRAFILRSGETLGSVIDGLTVTGGFALDGAGVYLTGGSSATIRRCVFTGNTVPVQSGIIDNFEFFDDSEQLLIHGCTITGNAGSGVSATRMALLEVTATTIEGNSGDAIRLGLYPVSQVVVRDSGLSGNGGAGLTGGQGGAVEVTGCTVSGNGATGLSLNGTVVTVSLCTVTGNQGAGAGGLSLSAGTTGTVRNCLIADNTGANTGGLYLTGFGAIEISGCTLALNTATTFGGGGITAFGTDPTTITSTILWGNSGPGAAQLHLESGFNNPAKVAMDYSVLQGGAAGVFIDDKGGCCATSQLTYGPNNIEADPLFAGAGAGDYHLAAGSPCIDAGDPAFVPEAGESDLDGDPRIVGAYVDMGSDEFRAPADLNADGAVSVADLVALVLAWGPCPAPPAACLADLNGDGAVDVLDLVQMIVSWS
jgi:hypothetical protein